MKVNQLKVGSILSYFQMGLGVIIGLLYTPAMIRLLGQSEYGLYNTVSSTISLMSILSLGFNSSYIRYFAKYKKENNVEGIYKLNGLFLIIFSVIGLIALICGLFLSFHLEWIFDEGLTEREYQIAKILMLLLTVNLSVSFPMSVFSNIISANERFFYLKILGIVKTVFSPLITIFFLFMGYRSIAMVTVTLVVSLAVDLCYLYYVIAVLKNKFLFHGFEKGLFKSLFVYTSFIAINMIVDQINWNIDKILLGRFQGTEAVAVYSVGFSLYTYYQMFSTSISGVFTPKIHRIINETKGNLSLQRQQISELFIRVGRVQFLVLSLIAGGMVFFGKSFIVNFWAGSGYEDSYYVTLLLILPASIALIQNLGIEIQRAENKHYFRSIAYVIMAFVNLMLSIYLCQRYGPVGSAIGTAISLILANGIIMNIYYQKACNIDILAFWKNIIRMSWGLILPVMCGIFMRAFLDYSRIGKFLLGILIYTIVYSGSMWKVSMNEYEKNLIRIPVRKLMAGKNKK